jgi:hypothetical protein
VRPYLNLDGAGIAVQWYPEYDIPIRQAVAPVPAHIAFLFEDASGRYRREFNSGTVLVNPSDAARRLELGAPLQLAQATGALSMRFRRAEVVHRFLLEHNLA